MVTTGEGRIFGYRDMERIILLGSGLTGTAVAEFAAESNIALEMLVGTRQANTALDEGHLLIDYMRSLGAKVQVVDSLRGLEDGPYQTADENTLVLSLGSPFIIRQELIDLYDGRVINSHGAPLPVWRGGGGFSWRILAGDRRGTVCFHLVSSGIDDGKIIAQRHYEFPPSARYPRDYMAFAQAEERKDLTELLTRLLAGELLTVTEQREEDATYFPRLNTDTQGYIDWQMPGPEVERFVLAFSYPYSGAKSFVRENPVVIYDAKFVADQMLNHTYFRGLVFRDHADHKYIACEGGYLIVSDEHISANTAIVTGDRMHTPHSFIESSLALRPVYTPKGLREEAKN